MLSYGTVEPHTLELIKSLMACQQLTPYRLVGGTSLALQYGYRQSVDIDLFGDAQLDAYELQKTLQSVGELTIRKETDKIKIYTIDGVKVDIIRYEYPWLQQAIVDDGIRLASAEDIAAMKVNAIIGRGSKKDFIDLYFLLQHYSLKEILGFYRSKYPQNSMFQAMMSLTYFEDAESQMMPKMFADSTWEEMKKVIADSVTNLTR